MHDEYRIHEYHIRWVNKTLEVIENPLKAEYMARIEDRWRTSIHQLVTTAMENPSLQVPALEFAQMQSYVFGPESVEAAGKAWDEFHNPVLPTSLDNYLQHGRYAVGERQFVE